MTDVDLTTVAALTVLNVVMTIGSIAVRRRGDAERLAALEREMGEALAAHDERLARIEAAARSHPTHDDLAKIYERINETSRLIHRVEGTVEGMDNNLRLVLSKLVRNFDTTRPGTLHDRT